MRRKVEFIGSGYECVGFVMVDTPTIAEAYEAAKKWYADTAQDFHYIGMEIPKEYAYDESGSGSISLDERIGVARERSMQPPAQNVGREDYLVKE